MEKSAFFSSNVEPYSTNRYLSNGSIPWGIHQNWLFTASLNFSQNSFILSGMRYRLWILKETRKNISRTLDEVICRTNRRDTRPRYGRPAPDVRIVDELVFALEARLDELDEQIEAVKRLTS